MYSGGPSASPIMNHNNHFQPNTIPFKGPKGPNSPNIMSKTPPYIYDDHQQLQRRTTVPPNKSPYPHNNIIQYDIYNQMAPTAPKPTRPNQHKIQSAKKRTKNNKKNNNLINLPPNSPDILRNRSKTEGRNLNKNAHSLCMSTTQQIYTPPAPWPNHNGFDPNNPWQAQPPHAAIQENAWNHNLNAANINNQYAILAPTARLTTMSIPVTDVTHTNVATFGTETAENSGPTPVAAVGLNVDCPLRYMGCDGFADYNLNEHYTEYQEEHLDHIINYFENKFTHFENNYCSKLKNLEKENICLRSQLEELMDRMDRNELEWDSDFEMDNEPIMHNNVHSRIPKRNKPTDSKVPATFLQFQKSRSGELLDLD